MALGQIFFKTSHHILSWGSQEATPYLILSIISLLFPYPGCLTESALATTSHKPQVICQTAFLKGKVICWSLSQTISRIELPKVIGHVFMETDALFPNTALTYVHSISQIIFYWAKKTRAANVKDEMTCFIYFCKCYGQRETMKRATGLHTPHETQHVLSDSQRLGPFLLPSDWSYTSVSLSIIYIRYIYQSN